MIYTINGLTAALSENPPPVLLHPDCIFVSVSPLTLSDSFQAYRIQCLHSRSSADWLPLLQFALLMVAGLSGAPLSAACAILIPEWRAFLHPRMLPGSLLRTALLPLSAATALDASLARLTKKSPIRLHVPCSMMTASGCVFSGAALLLSAVFSIHALVPLLPVSLLWLGAPLLLPALDAPLLTRIPLSEDEQRLLHSEAQRVFPDIVFSSGSPRSMLAACAGCMLGILEPDEAARQILTALDHPVSVASAADLAALLTAAQYLREHMSDCDAVLRPLPTLLEQEALRVPLPEPASRLSAFLHAAYANQTPDSIPRISSAAEPLDALFLPLPASRNAVRHPLTLPLTHPHTYLRQAQLTADAEQETFDPTDRFLVLSASALSHPFYPLLMRSPIAGPYAVLMDI